MTRAPLQPASIALGLLLVALGCDPAESPEGAASDATPAPITLQPARSSSILLRGGALLLSSPDDDAVVEVAPDTLEVARRFAVPGAPEQLALLPSGRLLVTLDQAPEVALIDLTSGAVTRLPVPCGGTRAAVPLVASGRAALAVVSCPHDDRLVVLDPDRAEVRATFLGPPRPTALAAASGAVTVTSSHAGVAWRVAAASLYEVTAEPRSPAPLGAVEVVPVDGGDARGVSRFDALAVEPTTGELLGLYQSVDHDGDRDRPPSEGGYGSVVDGAPRIEPRVWGCGAGRYARFDGGRRVFSGPIAVAWRGGVVWVVNRFTRNVAALRCDPDADLMELLATFRVGAGARGVAVSPDGQVAWIDVGFDLAVARLDLNARAGAPVEAPAAERRREGGPGGLSVAASRGRSLFHDATNTHLTPSGVVACATCHPRGGDDGLVWFIHTEGVARKLRRTAPAWNARREAAPFHWDGEFATGAELAEDTIRELMEGDALLIDTHAIAAYMDEVPAPPPRPLTAAEAAMAEEGRRLFESEEVGCGGCHTGAALTNNTFHRVLPRSSDPDGEMAEVVTRPLRAVRARAPFLHDGRAATLRAVHAEHNPDDTHGRTRHLSAEQLDAIGLYLETL